MPSTESIEFLNFKKALVDLANADTPVVAELSQMFRELSKQPGFEELQKKLSEDGQKLAKAIFGIPEEVPARSLPKLLFGHPQEIVNQIFQDVDPIDLLSLATVSNASRSLVGSLSIKVKKICVCHSLDGVRIEIRTANEENFYVKIATSKQLVEESRRDGTTIRRIGNCEFYASRVSENYFSLHCSDEEELAIMLAQFFLGIYQTEDVSFYIDSPKKDFMLYVIKNITTKFSRFEISANLKLTDEEFRVVMEDISVRERFRFKSDREYNYDRPLQHKRMSMP